MATERLRNFSFRNRLQPVQFIEPMLVKPGVVCDVYAFEGDTSKDLGVITIEPGSKTPLQKVLKGDQTVEGYLSGKGTLRITRLAGEILVFPVDAAKKPFEQEVQIGDRMQWEAAPDSQLVVYEVCVPPYEDGRFVDLPE